MTYEVALSVSHRTPSGEVWEATGHGVTVKSKNPESAWALAALDRGSAPKVPVQFYAPDGTKSLFFKSVSGCAEPALKARAHFAKLTTQEAV
jgi:hypothetical protein